MRDVIYSPPDGEGPTVVRGVNCGLRCDGCAWRETSTLHHAWCGKERQPLTSCFTPSWCPIVSADPEVWERRLRGEV